MALTITAIPWATETSSTQLISFRFLIIIISVVFFLKWYLLWGILVSKKSNSSLLSVAQTWNEINLSSSTVKWWTRRFWTHEAFGLRQKKLKKWRTIESLYHLRFLMRCRIVVYDLSNQSSGQGSRFQLW